MKVWLPGCEAMMTTLAVSDIILHCFMQTQLLYQCCSMHSWLNRS